MTTTSSVTGAEACVADLRAYGLLPADTRAVFLVGSAALGWANDGSDYNLYVVSAAPWEPGTGPGKYAPLVPPVIPVTTVSSGGRTWQLKYWSQGQIDQVLAKVAPGGEPHTTPLAEIEELFLERLFTAVPVRGTDWLTEHRDRALRSGFQAATVARSLSDAVAHAEQAVGAEPETAVLAARLAFDATVDALLESHGNYGTYVPKWRARRMRQVAPPELSFASYWQIETMSTLDRDEPDRWVLHTLAFCRRTAEAIGARVVTARPAPPSYPPVPPEATVVRARAHEYVIVDEAADTDEPTGPHPVATGTAAAGQWRWTGAAVERLLARVTPERFAAGAARKPLRKHEELLLEHLITGTGTGGERLREAARRSAFGDFATTRSLGDGLASLEDADGQLAAGDVFSAVLSARKTFGHAVDALLERDGIYGTHEPHRRAQRFRAAAPAELTTDEYWAVETMAGLDPADPRAWVARVIGLSGTLLAAHPAAVTRKATRGPRRGW